MERQLSGLHSYYQDGGIISTVLQAGGKSLPSVGGTPPTLRAGTMSPRRKEDYLYGYKLGGSLYLLHGGRSPTSTVTDKEEVDIFAKEVGCLPTW
jgi:hypothetical protein